MNHAAISEEYLAQPFDVRGIPAAQRDELIVSLSFVDGVPVVLSRYGDDSWFYPTRVTNVRVTSAAVRFAKVPEAFRSVCKEIMYRYSRRGLDGVTRPSPARMKSALSQGSSFINHLFRLGIRRLSDVTPLACSTYLQACRDMKTRDGAALGSAGLLHRLLAVEMFYEVSQFTSDPMRCHPWPDSSASHLAGVTGEMRRGNRGGKTPLMPDNVFSRLFQYAWEVVERGDDLLKLRDQLNDIGLQRANRCDATIWMYKNRRLQYAGHSPGLEAFSKKLTELQTACYLVIASVSGCRSHELLFLQNGACRKEVDADGNNVWWLHSKSTKTGAGYTRWMVPEAAVKAVRVMERFARPYQALLSEEIRTRRSANALDPEIAEAKLHANALFLTGSRTKIIRTKSNATMNGQLQELAKSAGTDWQLATHQFRRKFANYAARSRLGDLRYLREHFKHWSLDMTLGYAMNGIAEVDLFIEIASELDGLKEQTVSRWLEPDTKLSGGYGRNLAVWRGGAPITLFRNRAHMVKSIASSTAFRSNGQAFCTADDNLCVGNTVDPMRCGDCNNAVIDERHAQIYQGLYDHLEEVLSCDDIGAGGRLRVQRDLDRCRQVLGELGFAPGAENDAEAA